MRCIHKWLSNTQTRLLANQYGLGGDSWLGGLILWLLTWIDTALYNWNRLEFGEARRKEIGPIFSGLGRIICVDYQQTHLQIQKPQNRGRYIGRLQFPPEMFSPNFLLFLDNTPGSHHHLYHNHLVKWVFNSQVRERMETPYLKTLIDNLSQSITLSQPRSHRGLKPISINGSCKVDFDIQQVERHLLDILFYVFLDLKLTDSIRNDLHELTSIGHALGPLYLTQRVLGKINIEKENTIIEWVMTSDIWKNYQSPKEEQNLGVREMSELILNGLLVAGFLGTLNCLLASLSIDIHGKGLQFKQLPQPPFQNYLLEVIRKFSPVNFINTKLPQDTYILIGGKEYLFPQSTIMSLSLLNSGYDPKGPFNNPYQFQPNRPNLAKHLIHFNHPGLGEEDQLLNNRGCPARFLVLNLLSKILSSFKI